MLAFLRRLLRTSTTFATVQESLWEKVESTLPCLMHLDSAERQALRAMALEFLADKVFSGAQGFEPDNFARLSISLQACLPVLKLGLKSYSSWRGVIVYPGGFIIPRHTIDANGLQHDYEEDALGEAWDGGPVILSWFDDPADYAGANVVIHEFAHKLDMLAGEADGIPPLHAGMNIKAWQDTFETAYEDFCARVDADEDVALDPYAAEHPAEFFAVASEAFFTKPNELMRAYPEVYCQLADFYRQHPAKSHNSPLF